LSIGVRYFSYLVLSPSDSYNYSTNYIKVNYLTLGVKHLIIKMKLVGHFCPTFLLGLEAVHIRPHKFFHVFTAEYFCSVNLNSKGMKHRANQNFVRLIGSCPFSATIDTFPKDSGFNFGVKQSHMFLNKLGIIGEELINYFGRTLIIACIGKSFVIFAEFFIVGIFRDKFACISQIS